ncbi:hypothetical protein A0H81_02435 [Grifola frondosa]|uniref:C3H1-type domain-containing protein n=1 Tax=Grifola frondosa TaxID=5627 RepID=A0A1C7MMP5_GRIFR|nr:hypothetical protein A0H81_02435 [Grifola frondosa]
MVITSAAPATVTVAASLCPTPTILHSKACTNTSPSPNPSGPYIFSKPIQDLKPKMDAKPTDKSRDKAPEPQSPQTANQNRAASDHATPTCARLPTSDWVYKDRFSQLHVVPGISDTPPVNIKVLVANGKRNMLPERPTDFAAVDRRPSKKTNEICLLYQRGRCKYEERCHRSHVPPDSQSSHFPAAGHNGWPKFIGNNAPHEVSPFPSVTVSTDLSGVRHGYNLPTLYLDRLGNTPFAHSWGPEVGQDDRDRRIKVSTNGGKVFENNEMNKRPMPPNCSSTRDGKAVAPDVVPVVAPGHNVEVPHVIQHPLSRPPPSQSSSASRVTDSNQTKTTATDAQKKVVPQRPSEEVGDLPSNSLIASKSYVDVPSWHVRKCRDFVAGNCARARCKFAHIVEDDQRREHRKDPQEPLRNQPNGQPLRRPVNEQTKPTDRLLDMLNVSAAKGPEVSRTHLDNTANSSNGNSSKHCGDQPSLPGFIHRMCLWYLPALDWRGSGQWITITTT